MSEEKHVFGEINRACRRLKVHDVFCIAAIFQERPYVCVALENSQGVFFVGMAKCSPTDVYDAKTGLSIATFRAVRKSKDSHKA